MLQSLKYAPWTSDIELAFYSALASLKINHDKLESPVRKVLGLYEINHRDPPERSTRMQIHGTALTIDETPQGYYRAEGQIRNFNTIEEYRAVDKTAHVERAGRMIWDAICDGSIYSCPSLLCSFSAICFADLKKHRFTYHVAYPALHSDPQWQLWAPDDEPDAAIKKFEPRDTTSIVDAVQTWRYGVDARQHGFFLAKRLRKETLEAEWRMGAGEAAVEERGDASLRPRPPRSARSSSGTKPKFHWMISTLSAYETGFFDNVAPEDRFVCFADPSTFPANPGWMLRNLLVLVRQRWHLDRIQILCYRDVHSRRETPTSLVLNLQSASPVHDLSAQNMLTEMTKMKTSSALLPGQVDATGELIVAKPSEVPVEEVKEQKPPPPLPRVTGWERGENNKMVPRSVDLSAYMDPTKLADQAVDLNLKLIKWRISPSIDLDAIKFTSCLLLGAGTLGAYVSRNLMGWGVRKITFVDDGRVSYSNPVRQPLYAFKDCEGGGTKKAERAAEVLREIYPGVEAEGHVMNVPMAGHAILDEANTQREFEHLRRLIDKHDAVFLLMDTREARWLPTVMAKAAGKVVINAALGFDTYMVMRHGVRADHHHDHRHHPAASARSLESPSAEELGCYFCSDVVAPADSLKSATLDQQCTVTRPGAAPVASALAVELLVSLTQHPARALAPAPPPPTSASIQPAPPTDPALPGSHPLGTVPHQLRGYMSTWQTLQIKGLAYDCCAACSPAVVDAYERDGWEFVKRALAEKGYVEELSGLAEVQRKAEEAEKAMEDWSEDEDDEGEGELV